MVRAAKEAAMYADQTQMLAKKKQTASILALVAAVLLAVSLFLPWLKSKHNRYLNASMTLLSFTVCRGEDNECKKVSNFELADEVKKFNQDSPKKEGTTFPYFGLITLIVCLGAAATMAAAGVLGLLGRFVRTPIALTTVGLLAACLGLITGCIFVAVKPGGVGAIGVTWPFFVFGTAIVLGVAACQMLSKAFGPPEYDPYADPMAPQPPM
jgi:4-amino-4-deoxy-L-arabinose transferase-like glycosyltransferase